MSRFSSVRSRIKDSLADERMALATMFCSSWELTVPAEDVRQYTGEDKGKATYKEPRLEAGLSMGQLWPRT